MAAELGSLLSVTVGDYADSWRNAGFAVSSDQVIIDSLTLDLVGPNRGRGALGWELAGIASSLDGLAHRPAGASRAARLAHPNGVNAVDHVVVRSGNPARTADALAIFGIEQRRRRRVEVDGTAHEQRFFWLGPIILELVGPVTPSDQPARIWGLALTSPDLDATAAWLGDRATPPKSAVQPGRQIMTIKTKDLGISVPLAVMSPHHA